MYEKLTKQKYCYIMKESIANIAGLYRYLFGRECPPISERQFEK